MTYEQIEKEFDERFQDGLHAPIPYEDCCTSDKTDEVKSFLKQSFIKYLQSEIVRLEEDYLVVHPKLDFILGYRQSRQD